MKWKRFESTAHGLFDDIFTAIYDDDKHTPSNKKTKLQWARVVALLHNLSFLRNQVRQTKIATKKKRKEKNTILTFEIICCKNSLTFWLHTQPSCESNCKPTGKDEKRSLAHEKVAHCIKSTWLL